MQDDRFMRDPIDENGWIMLTGSIEHVIYSNEENGYAICDLGTEDGDIVTITGLLPYVGEGDVVKVYGKWVHNPKYGRQFKVEQSEKQLPADRAAILRYLSSGAIKGVGPKTAKRIVDLFGEEAFDVIENHPEWLTDVSGITPKRARAISEDFQNKAGIRSAMMFFREFFGAAITVRIYKRWGSKAVDLAKRNPYLLCEEIDGIGFEKADRMALSLGLEKSSDDRLCSGILYLLSANAGQNGHVCLPREKVLASASKLLESPPERIEEAISLLLREGKLRAVNFDGISYLYEKTLYDHEKYIAKKLLLLDQVCPAMDSVNIGSFIQKEERESGVQYAPLQRQAIVSALDSGVMLLTGGPGTGKTTVVRALLHIFESMDLRIALCAPTGRAAKRLSESTSHEARTIHRLLEYSGEEGRGMHFHRDEHDLLEENVIIIDEASMVDVYLMSALLKAVKPGARVIIIGDADQLPSVGAGNVLRDLLESERFATVRLTTIFRQAEESLIVTNAHAINRGEMPRLDEKKKDFFFLPRQADAEIAATVAQLYGTRLPRTYGELALSGMQVICPSRKGENGTEHLNVILQATVNPPSPEKREHRFRELVFREGDRVMQIRNNYDLVWEKEDGSSGNGIFNGDIGVITAIHPASQSMEILFDDRHVVYDFNTLEELEMAYAITVHKSQGSEYPIVILPMGSTPPMLLSRNLLYTAVTRAQMMAVTVGREEVLASMVANNRQTMRYTGLRRWLREDFP
ncbi:MAG: ATP-dependent RecD-like DNA helicase [Clostridia bacterium]|nr:ATP-dependent RecD-like DNA helicase [Clostridia bacterium]MBQ1963646.1 ATP-dependent RecD-like DNA helicase [Clostridia bacterium]MBQ5833461.1 ATP-dependent RecD-like DNA helicase [Clostridia bacterium]